MNRNIIFIITGCIVATMSAAKSYELHEWGTFTTVSGSDGLLLNGLEREEESLPSYVLHHRGFQGSIKDAPGVIRFSKGVSLPVRNVKVKMETPVIYFHSDEAFTAKVRVGFKGGTISQWYPERSGGEVFRLPSPKSPGGARYVDFSEAHEGSIEWQVDVLSPEESRSSLLFNPEDLLQWTHARIPEANTLKGPKGGMEGFLFYRGIGSFEPGLKTTVDAAETLHLENRSGGTIPGLLIFERLVDGRSRWVQSEALESGGSREFTDASLGEAKSGFDREMFRSLASSLEARGLLRSEAEAMVKTWWKSYFETPGLRVFWTLPDSKTEEILPLAVSPQPDRTVRVMVGRSEVIRPRQEQAWLALANSEDEGQRRQWLHLSKNDRFGMAYTERVAALQTEAAR